MGKVNKILFCINSNETARGWLRYAIDSVFNFYNRHEPLIIYVASDTEFSYRGAKWIDARKHFHKLNLDIIRCRPYHSGMCSPMILFRLLIPMIDEFLDDKVLYIDSDIEIVDSRFFDIFDLEFDSDVAGVCDYDSFCRKKMNLLSSLPSVFSMMRKNAKERVKSATYLNSGVLLFNVPHIISMRPKYSLEINHLLDLMIKHRLFWDQDIINIYFSATKIPTAYNMFPKRFKHGDSVFAVHYASKGKLEDLPYPPQKERNMVFE